MRRFYVLLAIVLLAAIWAATRGYRYSHFPEVRDWNSVRITLERTTCFGTCPAYQIEIHGDGTVVYTGKMYVATVGERRGKISQATVHELVDAFYSAHYFQLNNSYEATITDNPTYTTSIAFDGVSKSVVDYAGDRASPPMPPEVSELENTIDRLARSEKWVSGIAKTLPNRPAGGDSKAKDEGHKP